MLDVGQGFEGAGCWAYWLTTSSSTVEAVGGYVRVADNAQSHEELLTSLIDCT